MSKRIISVIIALILLVSVVAAEAASYTLPEKMQNQLAIGSGLKGTFSVKTEGDLSHTPFLNAVSDATYDLRGMLSGHDLHYYLFQESNGTQVNLAELYRKEGKYYFRSDVLPEQILELSGFSVVLDSLLPAKGDNTSVSSALVNYLSLDEDVKEKKWRPVLTKYQNSLEMWLHDFTAQAEVVKQENGSSAFDFSYVIPADDLRKKLVSLFADFAGDAELTGLLDTIMTDEQKELYLNGTLAYFYQAAVDSLTIKSDIRLSRRVSALGDLISSKMILPLDAGITGYDSITIETSNGASIIQIEGGDKALVLGLPSIDLMNEQEYNTSVWFSKIDNDKAGSEENKNLSVRADIQKAFSQYNDEEDKSHQEEHYQVTITQDTTWLPEQHKGDELAEWHDIKASLDLHYHSKYSQNSATTLEINAGYSQNGSEVAIEGKVKTAAPWLFMPFEVTNPIQIGPDTTAINEAYQTDWISNAASMIHHTEETEETAGSETSGDQAETQAPEEAAEQAEASTEPDTDANDNAEAAPLPEQEEESAD